MGFLSAASQEDQGLRFEKRSEVLERTILSLSIETQTKNKIAINKVPQIDTCFSGESSHSAFLSIEYESRAFFLFLRKSNLFFFFFY